MEHELQWGPEDTPSVGRDELDAALGGVMRVGRARRARRRAVGSGLVALALVLGAVGVLRLTGDHDRSSVKTVGRPPTTTEPNMTVTTTGAPAVSTPTTAKPGTPVPPQVFVSQAYTTSTGSDASRIVVFDTAAKKPIRTVVEGVGGLVEWMAASPDRTWIYFSNDTCGPNALQRVRVNGPSSQQPEFLNQVASIDPEFSPDGTKVAYIALPECDGSQPQVYELHVQDVATKADSVVTKTSHYGLSSPTWSPDGHTLAVGMDVDGGPRVAIVDADRRDVDIAAYGVLTAPRPGWGFGQPRFLPDGTLFGEEVPASGTTGTVTMAIVDAHNGQHLRTVAVGDAKRFYRGTDADRSGNHLLYISSTDQFGGAGDLRLSSNGAKTVVLATGVGAAAW